MILVTGGTGLLGSHLLYQLVKDGEQVRAIFRNENRKEKVRKIFAFYDAQNANLLFEKIEWVKADVIDIPSLENIFEDITEVYHLAAIISYARKDFNRMMKVNREGTANMVNFSLKHGIQKFCFVSSTAAVSINPEDRKAPLIEANKWIQTSSTSGYAISKYSAEKEVWRGIEEGLNAFIINPSVIMGAGIWGESSLQIPQLVAKGFPFYSRGINAIVDVRDVVYCMVRGMKEDFPSDRYLCAGHSVSFHELMNQIADRLNVKRPKWKAHQSIAQIALFLDFIKGTFTGKRILTKESIETAYSKTYYDSSKIKKTFQFEFRPIKETIDFLVKGRMN